MQVGFCGICHKERKTLKHHLSYDPEILLDVCSPCHLALHTVDIGAFQKLAEIKKQYGHLWENGYEKYLKSPWKRAMSKKACKKFESKLENKIIRREAKRAWYRKPGNKEKVRETGREWRAKNKEACLQKAREYYKRKRLDILAHKRGYYDNNGEEIKKIAREKRKNPEMGDYIRKQERERKSSLENRVKKAEYNKNYRQSPEGKLRRIEARKRYKQKKKLKLGDNNYPLFIEQMEDRLNVPNNV